MFKCTKCDTLQSANQFNVSAKGYRSSWCKSCRAKHEANRRASKGIKPKNKSFLDGKNKYCTRCETLKPYSDFSPAKRSLGGLSAHCKKCNALRARQVNKELVRERTAKYRKNNRSKYLANHRIVQFNRKNNIKVLSDDSVTTEILDALYGHNECFYCAEIIEKSDRTIDHKIPLSKGGSHSISNLVMACKSCNSAKRNLTDIEFIDRIKYDRN